MERSRSGRAFVRNGKPVNNVKQRNEMVKCAQGDRTQQTEGLRAFLSLGESMRLPRMDTEEAGLAERKTSPPGAPSQGPQRRLRKGLVHAGL